MESNIQPDKANRYEGILETMEEGYFEVDLEGNYTFVNDSVCKIHGASREELIGLNYKKYMENETAKKVRKVFNQVYQTGMPYKLFEWEIIKADGTKAVEESSVYLIRNARGARIGFRGIFREISERKKTQEVLRQSEERYRTILDNIEEGYFEVDLSGNFIFVNESLGRIIGLPKERLLGMNNREYMDEKTAQRIYEIFKEVYRTGLPGKVFEWEIKRENGTRAIEECSVSLIRNVQGEGIGFRGIMRDATERKRLEEEREKFIAQLQEALAKVKTLSGFLPICASCKKIRDDRGYWMQIEAYIRDHSEAEFSHGICPECKEKLYGSFLEEENKGEN